MSKTTGLGDHLYVAGYDISGDIGAVTAIGGGPAVLDVTGIDKSAFERIGGKRDGRIEFTSYYNVTAGQGHAVLSALPTADEQVMYGHGAIIGNDGAAVIAKQINYDGTRAQDGAYTFQTQALANGYGVEWGTQLTAGKRTDTGATDGTSFNFSAATSFGWQAYLQVFAVTGTSVTVKIQDSADNVTFADLAGATFTAATGITTQRLASAGATDTVRQYVRVSTTGTFNPATFIVLFVKNASVSVAF